MPIAPTYPGVYIEEIPSGVHTITGVATSVTAFVGRALRGPVNKQTTITSFADYERKFGGLWQLSSMSFAVSDFFLNGGSIAIIVRVFNETAPAATPAVAGADAGAQQAIAAVTAASGATAATVAAAARRALGATPPKAADDAVKSAEKAAAVAKATPQDVVDVLAKSFDPKIPQAIAAAAAAAGGAAAKPGDVSDAVRKVVGPTPASSSGAEAIATSGETAAAKAGATPADVTTAVNKAAADAGYPDLAAAVDAANKALPTPLNVAAAARVKIGSKPSAAAEAVVKAGEDAAKAKDATGASVVEAMNAAMATAPAAAAAAAPATAKATLAVGGLNLEAASEGKWGANLAVRVDSLSNAAGLGAEQVNDIAAALGVATGDVFTLTVHENGGATEQFANVTVVDSPRRVDKILLNSSLVQVSGALPAAPPPQSPGKPGPDPWDTTNAALASGGSDGGPIGTAEILGDDLSKHGIYALKDADIFNILVIPPPVPGIDNVYTDVVGPAVAFCEAHRAFMIIDPPSSWISVDVVTQQAPPIGGTASNYAAIYFPALMKRNPLKKNLLEAFPASGAIAGIYARTDAQRGVWKAPAGLEATLTGTSGLTLPMNDLENGELNQLGVNCLRVKPAIGPVVWGARTTAGDDRLTSEWKYIPVRRTALFLEESLYRATQWVVFEPNDEPLWSQIRLNVGAFMQSLFRQGAFQGTTPRDAYFVKCDDETTTQNDINNGIVNIVVGFAPLKPAEFVIVQIQQIAGQIQT